MSRLIKLYPPEWRRRYGPEMEELAAAHPGWRTQIDLLRGALDAWTTTPGGENMTDGLTKLAAALIVIPTFFVATNVVNELRGTDDLLFESFFQSGFGTAIVILGPFLALALVLLPSIRFDINHQQRGPELSVSLRLGRFQIVMLAIAGLTALALLGYAFVENYAPRAG